MGVLQVGTSKGVEGGTNVKEGVNGESERGGAEVIGKSFNILGVRKVVAEGMDVEEIGRASCRERV